MLKYNSAKSSARSIASLVAPSVRRLALNSIYYPRNEGLSQAHISTCAAHGYLPSQGGELPQLISVRARLPDRCVSRRSARPRSGDRQPRQRRWPIWSYLLPSDSCYRGSRPRLPDYLCQCRDGAGLSKSQMFVGPRSAPDNDDRAYQLYSKSDTASSRFVAEPWSASRLSYHAHADAAPLV